MIKWDLIYVTPNYWTQKIFIWDEINHCNNKYNSPKSWQQNAKKMQNNIELWSRPNARTGMRAHLNSAAVGRRRGAWRQSLRTYASTQRRDNTPGW